MLYDVHEQSAKIAAYFITPSQYVLEVNAVNLKQNNNKDKTRDKTVYSDTEIKAEQQDNVVNMLPSKDLAQRNAANYLLCNAAPYFSLKFLTESFLRFAVVLIGL